MSSADVSRAQSAVLWDVDGLMLHQLIQLFSSP